MDHQSYTYQKKTMFFYETDFNFKKREERYLEFSCQLFQR